MNNLWLGRIGLILIVVASCVSGILSLHKSNDLDLTFADRNGRVVISGIDSDNLALPSNLHVGDTLLSIGDILIVNHYQATKLTTDLFHRNPLKLVVKRSDHTLAILVNSTPSRTIFFILLNTLLGLLFIFVGILVGWGKRRDPTGRAYYRLTFVAGCSILLSIFENPWQNGFVHFLHAFSRLAFIGLIPPLLVDFLFRFCNLRLRSIKRVILYLPSIIIIGMLLVTYTFSETTGSPGSIALFLWTFSALLGAFMAIYFVIALFFVIKHYLGLEEPAHRDQMRWLLIVTVVGLLPYFFYYRLPPVFGYEPLVPLWTVFSLMLIVPTGWGMAVASFRMLNVEWVLSRTIIYTIAIIFSSFFLLTLLLIFGEPFTEIRTLTLKTQIITGIVFLLVTASGLSAPIRWVIDRLYYRDWFDEQEAVRQLGEELSKALVDGELIEILTVKLPEILHVQRVALVHGSEGRLKVSGQSEGDDQARNKEILEFVHVALEGNYQVQGKSYSNNSDSLPPNLGFDLLLPLRQGGLPVGALLIGRKKSGAVFSEKDFVLLNALSNHTASALANISLTRQLVEQEKRAFVIDMAGGIAHEINNSLAPLMGQAQLTEMKVRSNEFTSSALILPALDIVIQMSERIKRIASNLSRLSQPPTLEPERLTLESIAEEALVLIRETAGRIKHFSESNPNANFKLKRDLSKKGTLVWGDRQQLGQVYLNLIVNAADALEEHGSGTIIVGVREAENGQGAIGFVADDGPGIPVEIQDRILQPYFTTKIKGKGTGLGLAIVKQIIELHQGTLKIVSVPGSGARFEFFIPSILSEKI